MQAKIKKVRQSINKAWRKVKPNRSEIDLFKKNLIELLIDRINEEESEEHHKKLVSDFLEKTYYSPSHYINTKGRSDQVIHNGKESDSSVGVIIEAKSPTNKGGMLSKKNINAKALQELVLYYMRERIIQKNLEIKYLVATNMYEWFIFDATVFEKTFAQSKSFVKQFTDFEAGRLSGTNTDFFYSDIAKPFIEEHKTVLEFTWFDLREYEKPLRNNDKKDDAKLIALYKLFSPEHLLKLPFANDSNSLDRKFYTELLHIIGLEETKVKGKKLIGRKEKERRDSGSMLENAITHIDSHEKLSRLPNVSAFGETKDERLFNVALELCITWVNRILFLKLLEAQLIAYNKGDQNYSFLNLKRIKDYDVLDTLFFQVLAREHGLRSDEIQTEFGNIPYLNSSLFDPTDLEHDTLMISNLRDEMTIPMISGTVLKDSTGKKITGTLSTLEYLFRFLDAYDFSGEGSEAIQEDNKTLINASVLGLIFEKINGYKDGSFFTPGFITMYMCRETIRRAVVQKFNEAKGWDCEHLDDVYNKIEDRTEANAIINSLKICDPAVGSGHFLVSALNEILAIKYDLNILQDRNGRWLKEYELEVVNDELIITDDERELFEYHPGNKESQRVQETLFHEKQTIIENCLFGVDINPNSVKICRLRLWIELLKHAYYKSDSELETLPNIDINIKTGNSLISRFALDASLKQILRTSKWSIDQYRDAVENYRNASSKEEKREMEQLISATKKEYSSKLFNNDPINEEISKARMKVNTLINQTDAFGKKASKKEVDKAKNRLSRLEEKKKEQEENKIYENAFEWRFEFPEVLNDDGDFVGFDVVIGNPPYIRQEEFKEIKPYLQNQYSTYAGTADMYVYFVERAFQNLKEGGHFTYIIPNKWMRAGYGKNLRNYLKAKRINTIIDFGDLPVFEEATTYPCILGAEKITAQEYLKALNVESLDFPEGLDQFANQHSMDVLVGELPEQGWTLTSAKEQQLLAKLKTKGTPLGEYVHGKIFYGIKTGLNEAFVIDEETKNRLIEEDYKSAEIIKPFLAGRGIKRFQQPHAENYLILFKNGDTKEWFGGLDEASAWEKLKTKFPSITSHLIQFKEKATKRYDQGQYWWELRACDYYEEFEKTKLIYPNILKEPEFTFDDSGSYTNQKCFIITEFDLSLLAILNSRLTYFLFKSILPKLRGDFYEPSYMYFKLFPIAEDKSGGMKEKVNQILELKKENPQADTSALEAEIDQMVYGLYGLTEEEIAIVEESVG